MRKANERLAVEREGWRVVLRRMDSGVIRVLIFEINSD